MSGHDSYLEAEVMTASPYRLHLLTVEGAIRFAKQAVEALERKDLETAHFALNTSRGLVGELIGGLDETQAPEMVGHLKAIFVFTYRNLALADMEHDSTRIHSALRILNLHRETWIALQDQLRQLQQSPPEVSAPSHDDACGSSTGRSWIG